MREISDYLHPRETPGLKRYRVDVQLERGRPQPDVLVADLERRRMMMFEHAAERFAAFVWARSIDDVGDVLRYHWPDRLSAYTVHEEVPLC